MIKTREQARGDRAFQHIQTLSKGEEAERYGQYAHKLPILIRQAGLAQALTFAHAKKATRLIEHLADQLHSAGLLESKGAEALMSAARTADLMRYQRLSREVMACLSWYKRFVESVLGIDAGEEKVAP